MARSQTQFTNLARRSGDGAKGKAGGLPGPQGPFHVVVFDNDAREGIKKRLREYRDFTDVFVAGLNVSSAKTALCLISLDGERIDRASLMRQSRAISTGKLLLKFFGVRSFPPVALAAIEKGVPSAADSYSNASAGTLRPVAAATEHAVLQVVRGTSNEAEHVISELEKLRAFLEQKFDENQFRVIAQEKDALVLLAEIWGVEREQLPEWTWAPSRGATPPRSYFDGITRSHESHLVTKDIARMKQAFFRGGRSTTCAEALSSSRRVGARPSLSWT